jgi:uncharacterized protein with HEPN domain
LSDDQGYVLDILGAARQALEYVEGADKEAFLQDRKTQDAVVRQLEVLGEAAGRVGEEFRAAHPEIDWSGPIRLRSVLIHQYRRISLDRVWETVVSDLPRLITGLEPLVEES